MVPAMKWLMSVPVRYSDRTYHERVLVDADDLDGAKAEAAATYNRRWPDENIIVGEIEQEQPTMAHAQVIEGVTFRCYKVGIGNTAWFSEGFRARISLNSTRTTYSATVDGQTIGRRFQGSLTAIRAAAKALNEKDRT